MTQINKVFFRTSQKILGNFNMPFGHPLPNCEYLLVPNPTQMQVVGMKHGILIYVNILFKLRLCKVCSAKQDTFLNMKTSSPRESASVWIELILTFDCSTLKYFKFEYNDFSWQELLACYCVQKRSDPKCDQDYSDNSCSDDTLLQFVIVTFFKSWWINTPLLYNDNVK